MTFDTVAIGAVSSAFFVSGLIIGVSIVGSAVWLLSENSSFRLFIIDYFGIIPSDLGIHAEDGVVDGGLVVGAGVGAVVGAGAGYPVVGAGAGGPVVGAGVGVGAVGAGRGGGAIVAADPVVGDGAGGPIIFPPGPDASVAVLVPGTPGGTRLSVQEVDSIWRIIGSIVDPGFGRRFLLQFKSAHLVDICRARGLETSVRKPELAENILQRR